MARAALSLPFSGLSGSLGDTTIVQRPGGPVVRARVYRVATPTAAQRASAERMSWVARAWAELDDETFAAWGRYAEGRAWRNPATGAMVAPKAFNVFSGLANKRRQIDPVCDLSEFGPPVRAFTGDCVIVSVEEVGTFRTPTLPSPTGVGEAFVTFAADRANAAGVLTELLVQPLANRRRKAYRDKYVSRGFVAFAGVETVEVACSPGAWACAFRFVEAATGLGTELVELGVAVVG